MTDHPTDKKFTSANPVQLITMAQLCEMLAASESSVLRWVKTFEGFPQPVRFATGTIRFRLHEVEEFVRGLPRREYDDHGFDPNGG
ncbi:helix-turn-helix transcriptional regulator [Paracoccus sphaerophysae]|uniref:helix-turn-helix transcriptional regulator n=1 Tax=Paracoccus sphaerophysae TaxID=690417 RepID=UPI002357DC46|nr:hypothetical protein [Paracoccus sphaerophysae]